MSYIEWQCYSDNAIQTIGAIQTMLFRHPGNFYFFVTPKWPRSSESNSLFLPLFFELLRLGSSSYSDNQVVDHLSESEAAVLTSQPRWPARLVGGIAWLLGLLSSRAHPYASPSHFCAHTLHAHRFRGDSAESEVSSESVELCSSLCIVLIISMLRQVGYCKSKSDSN